MGKTEKETYKIYTVNYTAAYGCKMHAVFNEHIWKELVNVSFFRMSCDDGTLLFISNLNKPRFLLGSKN